MDRSDSPHNRVTPYPGGVTQTSSIPHQQYNLLPHFLFQHTECDYASIEIVAEMGAQSGEWHISVSVNTALITNDIFHTVHPVFRYLNLNSHTSFVTESP